MKWKALATDFDGTIATDGFVDEPTRQALLRLRSENVRFINDAAMQALGNYRTGRIVFFGLGTSTGATAIVDDAVVPIEIGTLRLSRKERFMDLLSKEALKRDGIKRWMKSVHEAIAMLQDVFHPDETILGGGNAKHVDPLPPGCV